jgi:DHA1 family tetracycline resistance protein-like MFS transporter
MHKRALAVLFFTLLLDLTGIGMLVPIIPILFTDPSSPDFILHGYSVAGQYFIAGLITALFGLMQFIAAPLLGELSDVYGRKRLLTVGVGVLAVSNLVFGWGIQTTSLALLLISRAVAGLAGANFSIAQAAIADVSKPEDRAKNFGLMGAAFGIGFILGPILGGWIAGIAHDAAAPFWFAGALGILNVVSVSLFLPETNHHRTPARSFHVMKGISNIRAAFTDKDARPVYLANFLYNSGFAFFTSFIGILVVARFAWSEADIGTFFGVIGLWIVFTQVFVLRSVAKFFHERQILRLSIVVAGAMVLFYPFVTSVPILYVLVPLLAIPQGLTNANITALISKSVSPEKQGAALGINGSLLALSQGAIPLLAGVGSGIVGLFAPFIAGGILMLLSWCVLFLKPRRA